MTGIYNVLARLRVGQPLSDAERRIHDAAACGVLRDLHYRLDSLVASAYGWPWPMQRAEVLDALVALHDERRREEDAGEVRWLRPEYQVSRCGGPAARLALPSDDAATSSPDVGEAPAEWPSSVVAQITAIQEMIARSPATVDGAARQFRGARRDLIARHLETLAVMGEVRLGPDGRYHAIAAG